MSRSTTVASTLWQSPIPPLEVLFDEASERRPVEPLEQRPLVKAARRRRVPIKEAEPVAKHLKAQRLRGVIEVHELNLPAGQLHELADERPRNAAGALTRAPTDGEIDVAVYAQR